MLMPNSELVRGRQKCPFGISYTNKSVAVDIFNLCSSKRAQRICELDSSQTSIRLGCKLHNVDNSFLKSQYLESEFNRRPYLMGTEPSKRITRNNQKKKKLVHKH